MTNLRQIVDSKTLEAYGTSEGATKGWDERGRSKAKEILKEHGWKEKKLKYTGSSNEHGNYSHSDPYRRQEKERIELGRDGWAHVKTSFGLGRDIARGKDVGSLADHLATIHKNKS